MKRIVLLITIVALYFTKTVGCDIHITAHWKEIGKKSTTLTDSQILIGSITFHKREKKPIKLENLVLAWHGPTIDQLSGSLFKKISHKPFLPIEEQFMCDSTWNKKEQKLVFDLNSKRQSLGANSIFYIVLIVQKSAESTIKSGHLSLVQTNLPDTWCTGKYGDFCWTNSTR